MLKGKVPYLDYFDHKGPLLYLIEYAGLMISRGSTNGLWVVEVINMAAALVILVRLCFLLSRFDFLCIRISQGLLSLKLALSFKSAISL